MFKKLLALSTYCGTIIGVGLFGLPYVTEKIGFLPIIFYFLFLGFVAIIIHLIFGEVILRTKGQHRLPGYAEIYLGKRWKIFSSISGIIGISGALLAYIIVGGKFLSDLIQPYLGGPEVMYLLLYFGIGILLIYLGTKSISKTELIMLFFFFIIIIIFLLFLRRVFPVKNLTRFTNIFLASFSLILLKFE